LRCEPAPRAVVVPAYLPPSREAPPHGRTIVYDPSRIQAPVAIIRGEWDDMCPDTDARWLFDALSPVRRDIKIGRATHLMHLEENRFALYREAEVFLSGGDQEEL
jgi:pimeloyl-ACP methyl ester carboxylesterase